ncbi:adenylate/guanylate cyclase domain-containing protein [Vibrio parahaemolyticus]|uniref:adenylate/guanylate cyclase domain-containing protein n=1 Tax=Vibrio parahaemolyticus TaxID=670 RepID=UPI001E5FFE4F|nr:adenylate/guanylate cyclase domain-containing protein [Vibrio parahaemolyticus]ELB2882348.1 adenylate/guanylate cyclase domain-containing protein [Vibrio alginolyticus]EIU6823006.1 adenylate/guanylate cyclase domain-containing protein [Vibrio parahaemolyticus]EJG0668980.1 adenylate/guanylate cyclase domain-containing protein [Vibrio parahaemolyticus]MCX8813048.1 adenylate/guanylate cyclase domain-containing protein [Vibrio parahaemolyticus]MCX8835541.1 adenylate/guanylate cyclase domain-con
MKASYSLYDFEKSRGRIDEILQGADTAYIEKESIPSRDDLTFTNGFNVWCTALFVDIRKSKELNRTHTNPVLAKIYKTYISELVAIIKSHTKIREICIEGDCVWGIFDTPQKSDIDEVFSIGAQVSSLIDVLNIKYRKRGYSELTVGIGMSYGKSLLVKSGHKGSGINEVVWLGSLVSEAAELCGFGNKSYLDREMMVSEVFYGNLNDRNKGLLEYNAERDCYHGYVVDRDMNEWVQKNG